MVSTRLGRCPQPRPSRGAISRGPGDIAQWQEIQHRLGGGHGFNGPNPGEGPPSELVRQLDRDVANVALDVCPAFGVTSSLIVGLSWMTSTPSSTGSTADAGCRISRCIVSPLWDGSDTATYRPCCVVAIMTAARWSLVISLVVLEWSAQNWAAVILRPWSRTAWTSAEFASTMKSGSSAYERS